MNLINNPIASPLLRDTGDQSAARLLGQLNRERAKLETQVQDKLFVHHRGVIAAIVLSAVAMSLAGCSVFQLQTGLEAPSAELLARAQQESSDFTQARPVAEYANIKVHTDSGVVLSMYARESASATANVVLIHGAGAGAWAWEEFLDRAPPRYNLYVPSWRGHFDSDAVPDADTADHARDQAQVLSAIRKRNPMPVHVVGHSYGGATAVLQLAAADAKVASVTLLAPVVPLDYTFAQRLIIPTLAPFFIRRSMRQGNDPDGVYGGMFLSRSRMRAYYQLYAGKPHAIEKPGLIAKDGVSATWQRRLNSAYVDLGNSGIPVHMIIARYDNVVVPGRQRMIAQRIGATSTTVDSGHYLQLDYNVDFVAGLVFDWIDEPRMLK